MNGSFLNNSLPKNINIVTDLINALPGTSSVNTVQHAKIGRMFIVRY
jgi:hypothetical protein